MAGTNPHITIRIARHSGEDEASIDFNVLSLGFGLLLAWIYMAIFGMGTLQSAGLSPSLWSVLLTLYSAKQLFKSYFITLAAVLILIALTHQVLLKFYLGRTCLISATCLGIIGTLVVFLPPADIRNDTLFLIGGICMGTASAILMQRWGIAFSGCKFSTVTLNAALANVIAISAYFVFNQAVQNVVSGIVAALTLAASTALLWKLSSTSQHKRDDKSAFRSLGQDQGSFVLRIAAPSLLLGISFGVLLITCNDSILSTTNLTEQLIIAAAIFVALGVLFVLAIGLSPRNAHWDMMFRILIPVVALGLIALSFLGTEYALLAAFCVICSFLGLQTILWVFLANLAQKFSISPLLVFGWGQGFITAGSLTGAYLAPFLLGSEESHLAAGIFNGSATGLLVMFTLIMGYALLPREREIRTLTLHATAVGNDEQVAATEEAAPVQQVTKAPTTHTTPSTTATDAHNASSTTSPALSGPQATLQTPDETTARSTTGPIIINLGDTDDSSGKHWFRSRCDKIAEEYQLSRRESEVLFLLAKGHNASYIQDKLCISRSTAKTHINHIYKKLNIHTQQQLLTMLENVKPAGEPSLIPPGSAPVHSGVTEPMRPV